jgi:site-specific recombinase XerC
MKFRLDNIIQFETWLRDRGLNDSSIYQYVRAAQKFLLHNNPEIDNIEHYNEFILEFSIKKRSLYYYDALKLLIAYAFKDDSTRRRSMQKLLLKPSKVNDSKRTRKFLDDDTRTQVIKLMKDNKHRIIAKLQNEIGVRAGDIFRLKRGSISYEAYGDKAVMRIDFVGKGGKHFVKWIFNETLQNQIELFAQNTMLDTEYYFLERDKGNRGSSLITLMRTNYHHYWSDLKQALNLVGVEYKDWATHDFRRAFARTVWDKTKDLVVLKDSLDHSDVNTTLIYLKNSGLQTKDLYYELDQERQNK